jgi:hypothetical protein
MEMSEGTVAFSFAGDDGSKRTTRRGPSSRNSGDAKAPGRYRLKPRTSIPLTGCIAGRT